MSRRGLLVAALAVAAATTLTACGGRMPDSGVAGPGRAIGETRSESLQIAPYGPRPDAEPREIVGGFLKAGAGFDDDHAVARTFLDGDAFTSWRPGQGALIYPDDQSLTVKAHGSGNIRRVVVSAPVFATIDAQGRYTLARPGTKATSTFQVRRLGQVWRIEGLDDKFGLWLPRYEFDRAYTPLRVEFVAVGTKQLVSDLRWFAGSRASLATSAVRAMLAGPPDYLRGAVTSGFPPGTSLGVDAVPTSDGIAQVDLSALALSAAPEERQQLWSQLSATLLQLPNVTGINVTVDGSAFPVPGVEVGQDAPNLGFRDDVPVAGPALVLSGGHLMAVDSNAGTMSKQVRGRFADVTGTAGLRSIAAGPHDDVLVGVDTTGRRLYSVKAPSTRALLTSGGDLVTPTVDPTGWAWTADRTVPGRLLLADVSAEAPSSLRPAWLAGRQVTALDVSRDGARVAVVSTAADGSTRLDVAGVVRDATGRPTALGVSWRMGQPLASMGEVSWADRTSLVVLGGKPGQLRPYAVEVGGRVTALPKLVGAVGVWAGSGVSSLYVTTSNGQVAVRSGNGWRMIGPGSAVTIPA